MVLLSQVCKCAIHKRLSRSRGKEEGDKQKDSSMMVRNIDTLSFHTTNLTRFSENFSSNSSRLINFSSSLAASSRNS